MHVLIDTFSWKKLDILEEDEQIGTGTILDQFNVCITHAVFEEINHFKIKLHYPRKVSIIPYKNHKVCEDARLFGFDEADASIASACVELEDSMIVSEDRPLLAFGKGYGLKIVQLIDFFRIMTMSGIISRNDLYRANRKLREMKNISKIKEKSIKEWLQSHSID